MTIEKLADRLPALLKGLDALTKLDVLVGVPAEEKERTDGPASGPNNAMLAYVHDNGMPELGIPARPFMKPGVRDWQAAGGARRFRDAGRAAVEGRPDDVEKNFAAAGIEASAAIKRRIDDGIPPPLAPATLAARKRRGFAGEKALLVTGQMRNAITFVLRRREK